MWCDQVYLGTVHVWHLRMCSRRNTPFKVQSRYQSLVCSIRYVLVHTGTKERLDNIGWRRTEQKSSFPMSLTSSSCSRDRNKYGGYGEADQLLQVMLSLLLRCEFIDEYFSLFATWTIFFHIDCCHDRTTMTSDASENTIFVRFYFILCYVILTQKRWHLRKRNCPLKPH